MEGRWLCLIIFQYWIFSENSTTSYFSIRALLIYWIVQWVNSRHGPCFPGRWNGVLSGRGEALGSPVAVSRVSLLPFTDLVLTPSSSNPRGDKLSIWTSHDFLWSLFPWFGDYSITMPCSLMPRTYRRWWEKSLPLMQRGTLEMKGNVYWSQYTPVNEMVLQT